MKSCAKVEKASIMIWLLGNKMVPVFDKSTACAQVHNLRTGFFVVIENDESY